MDFSIRKNEVHQPDAIVNRKQTTHVSDFKYLDIVIDLHQSFEKHVKKHTNTVKYNLRNLYKESTVN